jgi:clostripain
MEPLHTVALALACTLASWVAPRAERPWTILVYGAADNNADGPILEFLGDVRAAIDDDPGIELVLYLDRSKGFSDDAASLGEDFAGARLYRLRRNSAERLDPGEFFPGMNASDLEADSADPDNVARFIAFGKARFPAQRYGLMIYSHANGEDMCPDEESGRSMGIAQLTDVVPADASVDFLALELCNMAGIEIAYQWRPGNGGFGADVLVAIPNAGPPLDWDRAFARIRSPGHAPAGPAEGAAILDPAKMTAEDFGRLVVEEGEAGRRVTMKTRPERVKHEAAASYDLRVAGEVKKTVDALAVALARGGARDAFFEMRGPGPIGNAMNYSEGGAYVDLYDFAARIEACDAFDEATRAAAGKAATAVDRFVSSSFGMDGYTDFQPGRNGVFIVVPLADKQAAQTRNWSRFGWYTPLAGKPDGPYGRWSFLADGAKQGNGVVENWFELLDSWCDEPTPEGGLNGYRW